MLLIENLDPRSVDWRTAEDLSRALELVPNASVCIDLAHAAKETHILEGIIDAHLSRIQQVHLSEICYESGAHLPEISPNALEAAVSWLRYLPKDIPVIVELGGKLNWTETLKQVANVAAARQAIT